MMSTTRQLMAVSRALVLGAAVTVAATSVAAQTADSTRPPAGPGMRGGMGPGRGMRAGARQGPDMDGPRGPRGAPMGAPGLRAGRMGPGPRALLRGITLSVEQERALRATQAKHLLEAKPLRLEMLSASTDRQLARLNGDQKALDAATARVETARTKLDSLRGKRSPVEALRGVLTPDQQKILDRNLAEGAGRGFGPGRGPGMGPGRGPGMGPGEFGPQGGMRFRDGGSGRGFRNAPPPRRPAGEDLDGEEIEDFDIPSR